MLPDSDGVSPAPPYLRINSLVTFSFRVRDFYPLWSLFPERSAKKNLPTPLEASPFTSQPPAVNKSIKTKHSAKHETVFTKPSWLILQFTAGFRLFRVRSPLLAESLLISFPSGTKMFQFPECASLPYVFRQGFPFRKREGFPIRTFPDQSLLGSSPRLFAACHVLHRSFQPRYPPHTLRNLSSQSHAN